MAKVFVTVNGIPVEHIIEEQIKDEALEAITAHNATEIRPMNFVKQMHTVSKFRNISGSRSGRGRVIYSRASASL